MTENIDWKEVAQQYYDDNGNNDEWVFDVVDMHVPQYYFDIAQEALRLQLFSQPIEKGWEEMPISQVFQMLIHIEYTDEFMTEYNKLLEEEE